MSWYSRGLNQTLIYWAKGGQDVYNKPSFSNPVNKDCRWQEKEELFLDSEGKEKKSQAVILVDEDMAEGDFVYLGELGDSSSGASEIDPTVVDGAYEIKSFKKTPGIKANEYCRKVWI